MKRMLEKQFKKIYVTLGFACNFNCLYCVQDEGYSRHSLCKDVPELSEKLLAYLDTYPYEGTELIFWGGEPLIYFASMKEIIERYGDKFKYGFVTNGSLLTEEIVSYFESKEITFALSHDGYATKKTRRVDVLEDPAIKSLLLQSPSFGGFASVYSAENSSYLKLLHYYKEQGFKDKPVQVDMIYNTKDTTEQCRLSQIPSDTYEKALKALLRNFDRPDVNPIAVQRLLHINGQIDRPELVCGCNVMCSTCKDMLNLDYEGNVYICHNSTYKLGTVEDSYSAIYQGYCDYLKRNFTPKCKDCDINGLCSGACLLLTEKGQEDYCRIRHIEIATILAWLEQMKGEMEDDTGAV